MSVVKRVASPWSDPTALLINNVEANLSFELFYLPSSSTVVAKNCSLVRFSAQGDEKSGTFNGSTGDLEHHPYSTSKDLCWRNLSEGYLSKRVSSIPCEKIPVALACSLQVSLSQWTRKKALVEVKSQPSEYHGWFQPGADVQNSQ